MFRLKEYTLSFTLLFSSHSLLTCLNAATAYHPLPLSKQPNTRTLKSALYNPKGLARVYIWAQISFFILKFGQLKILKIRGVPSTEVYVHARGAGAKESASPRAPPSPPRTAIRRLSPPSPLSKRDMYRCNGWWSGGGVGRLLRPSDSSRLVSRDGLVSRQPSSGSDRSVTFKINNFFSNIINSLILYF